MKYSDMEDVLAFIVRDYGIEILSDVGRVNALLMDYAPNLIKERKLLVSVMREGVCQKLLEYVGVDADTVQLGLKKCEKIIIDTLWITEDAAIYAINVLAVAVGLKTVEEVKKEEPENITTEVVLNKEHAEMVQVQMSLLSQYDVIGYKAFASKPGLSRIEIPSNTKKIMPKAFLNCINLKEVVIASSVESIGKGVFEGCYSLKRITCEGNKNYTTIKGLFIDKKNKAVMTYCEDITDQECKIPDGIEVINEKSFDRRRIRSIFLPKSLSTIEKKAFYMTLLFEKYQVDSKNTIFSAIDGVLHSRNRKVLLHYPQGKKGSSYILEDTVVEIGESAFGYATELETITFTASVERIGEKAFEFCEKLESLMLPSNVISIGDRAFQYCEQIKSVMLPRSIKEIGDYAFFNCKNIGTINVPREVASIGHMAFSGCENLSRVVIQENVRFIGDGAFIGCEQLEVFIKSNPYVEAYCKSHDIKHSLI